MVDISNKEAKIEKTVFINMLMRYWAYRKKWAKEPSQIYLNSNLLGDYVLLSRFNEMRARYEAWEKANGSPPNYIWIVKPKTPVVIDLFTICSTQTLSRGSTGQCVIYAQQKLQEWGFYPYTVDGNFGEYTEKACMAFQKATGHSQDGVLGPKTWSSFPNYSISKVGVLQGDEWVLATLRSKGNVETEQDFCNLLNKLGAYLYYYNQRQDQKTTVTTLKGNCADFINDLGLPYYRARGIACRGVHCQVKCLDGNWYGHYVLEIGPQGSKQYRDIAAWAKGKGLTQMICGTGTVGKDFTFLHYEGDYIP